MGIWKNATGGYRSGVDQYGEYVRQCARYQQLPQTRQQWEFRNQGISRDIQLVRLVERHELAAHLDEIGHPVDPDTIDAVLRGLLELTPDGKDKEAWSKIHKG